MTRPEVALPSRLTALRRYELTAITPIEIDLCGICEEKREEVIVTARNVHRGHSYYNKMCVECAHLARDVMACD